MIYGIGLLVITLGLLSTIAALLYWIEIARYG